MHSKTPLKIRLLHIIGKTTSTANISLMQANWLLPLLSVSAASRRHGYTSPLQTLSPRPSLPVTRPSPSSSLKPLCFSQKESKSKYSYFLERPNCVLSFPPLALSCNRGGGGMRLNLDTSPCVCCSNLHMQRPVSEDCNYI